MTRSLYLALAASLGLAACTPPPDSATRSGPDGVRVELTDPRTCLDRQCLDYSSRLGRVSQPGRESMRIPRGMVDEDGFLSASDFRELLILTRNQPSLNGGLQRLTGGTAGVRLE